MWPLSLFFANTQSDFLRYILPSILIYATIFLFQRKYNYFYIPIFGISFIEPKFAILPLLFLIIYFNKKLLKALVISIVVLIIFWKPFFGQTIFTFDYSAQQQIIQKSNLYNSVLLARTFQNKPRVIIDKFTNNFIALTDPNNYFFGFHPRQIMVDNQNLNKFPFLSLVFMLFGLYKIKKLPDKKMALALLTSTILNLSILKNFDRNDFILWIPIALIILYGISIFEEKQKNNSKVSYILFLIFTIPQIIRVFIE